MGQTYKLDDAAVQRLTEVLKNREDRKGDLEKIKKHLAVSNKPSALVMMMLGKLRKGEDIGEPEHKAAPGSHDWQEEVKEERDGGSRGKGKGKGKDKDKG